MESALHIGAVCTPSPNVVAREIEGQIVIVPLTAGIGDAEDELYTLNDTGQAIWKLLDGHRTLQAVATLLADEFTTSVPDCERDVLGFAGELTRRGILQAGGA